MDRIFKHQCFKSILKQILVHHKTATPVCRLKRWWRRQRQPDLEYGRWGCLGCQISIGYWMIELMGMMIIMSLCAPDRWWWWWGWWSSCPCAPDRCRGCCSGKDRRELWLPLACLPWKQYVSSIITMIIATIWCSTIIITKTENNGESSLCLRSL